MNTQENPEFSRILTAATINKKFCALLLSDPTKALKQGFQGEKFTLSEDQTNFLLSIHADTLPDLARQILQKK